MAFELTSEAFEDGGTIPVRYTCDGENVSPPLAWSGAPEGTKSFALFVEDPDAPRDPWPWLVGPLVAAVSLVVLFFALRPPKKLRNHPR